VEGLAPTGRTMRIEEIYFFRVTDNRLSRVWGLEDTWTRHRQLRGSSADLGEHGSLG
jgi:predicted ester cyclase